MSIFSNCSSVGWLVVPALVGVLRTLRVGSVWSEPLASGDSRTVHRSKNVTLPLRSQPGLTKVGCGMRSRRLLSLRSGHVFDGRMATRHALRRWSVAPHRFAACLAGLNCKTKSMLARTSLPRR